MSVEPFPLIEAPRVTAPDAGRREAVRDSLANLASSVGVAACWGDGAPQGVLVRSLMRISASPPRVLLNIDKAAEGHKALLAADVIGLSILSSGQREDADRCDAFGSASSLAGRWSEAADQPPTLRDALAAVSGRVRSRIDAGSHTLLILDLSDAEHRDGAPLVCFDQTYAG
jgi:flavin reductase (DIM6/NTAB) family NADH-FMN oxidoreductase RutF